MANNPAALAETETAYCNAAEVELNAQGTQVNQCNLEITETVQIDPNQSLQARSSNSGPEFRVTSFETNITPNDVVHTKVSLNCFHDPRRNNFQNWTRR